MKRISTLLQDENNQSLLIITALIVAVATLTILFY